MPKVHPPAKPVKKTETKNEPAPETSTLPDDAIDRQTAPAIEVPSQLDPSRPAGENDYALLSEHQELANRIGILEQHILRLTVLNPSDAVTEGERG